MVAAVLMWCVSRRWLWVVVMLLAHGGWWQRVGEDWRRQICINDESTVEQDYSGLHINLLYGLKGIQPEGDPYQLDLLLDFNAQEQRKIVKGLVLMAINA